MNYRGTKEGISDLESNIWCINTTICHEMGKKYNFYPISETTPAEFSPKKPAFYFDKT